MIRSKIFLIFSLFIFSSCIEQFTPNIKSKEDQQYVIHGLITNKEGFQYLTISKTTSINEPEYNPVSDCAIEIYDDDSNIFTMVEYEPGEYRVWIDKPYLEPGTAYKLTVHTPDGNMLESDYNIMPSCPQLDSIYHTVKRPDIIDPYDLKTTGMQFYLDFSGKDTDSKFLRWDLTETWEYKSTEGLYLTIDTRGWTFAQAGEHSDKKTCWKTNKVDGYYHLSTTLLSENKYKKLQLHYVDNHTQRLLYGYHLKVEQYAINKNAYYYWKQIEDNNIQQGGLYEKQPIPVKGNLFNSTNPDNKVFGFFEVASINTKSIFLKDVVMRWDLHPQCRPVQPDPKRHLPSYSKDPLYFNSSMYYIQGSCWDCTKRGGTNVKPDFWPY